MPCGICLGLFSSSFWGALGRKKVEGRRSVTVKLKATDWVAIYPVKIRRTVRVDSRKAGGFQKTMGRRRVPFTVRKTAYRRVALYLGKMRRVAQGALVEGKNELRDHHSRLNKGPIVG